MDASDGPGSQAEFDRGEKGPLVSRGESGRGGPGGRSPSWPRIAVAASDGGHVRAPSGERLVGPQGFEPWTDGLKRQNARLFRELWDEVGHVGISGRGARNRSTHLRHPCTVSYAEERGGGGARRVGSAREPGSMATSDSRREVRAWHGIPRLEAGRSAPGVTRDDRPDPMGPLIDDLVAEQHALDAALPGVPDAHWERPSPAEGGVLRDGITHLAEGDARARCVAETRRPLWPLRPLPPSPGRPPRRGGFCQISGHRDEPGQALPLAAGPMRPASPPSVTASV